MKDEYLDYILELLEPAGDISSGRMFGGYAIYKNKLPIALSFDDTLYFKVDLENQADYQAVGSHPFTYEKGGKTIKISNWMVPIEILDDPEQLLEWTEKAYQVALRADAKKQKKKKQKKP